MSRQFRQLELNLLWAVAYEALGVDHPSEALSKALAALIAEMNRNDSKARIERNAARDRKHD